MPQYCTITHSWLRKEDMYLVSKSKPRTSMFWKSLAETGTSELQARGSARPRSPHGAWEQCMHRWPRCRLSSTVQCGAGSRSRMVLSICWGIRLREWPAFYCCCCHWWERGNRVVDVHLACWPHRLQRWWMFIRVNNDSIEHTKICRDNHFRTMHQQRGGYLLLFVYRCNAYK